LVSRKNMAEEVKCPEHPDPLALFINSRSGGQQGATLTEALKAHLRPEDKIFDLSQGGPAPGLKEFEEKKKPYRTVACGGDGTVGWLLTTFDKVNLIPNPPMAILPLGTGNDISRTLNWGPGYAGEDLGPVLNKARASNVILMDRWKANFVGVPEADEHKDSIVNAYLGLGIDAEIALKFHNLREGMPGLFRNRTLNKLIYGQLGFTSMLASHSPFNEIVKMEVDGKPFEVPAGLTGILLLNLPSWGGGTNPWGPEATDGKFKPQVIDDSLVEVIGFTGAFHLAQIQSGLQYGIRITQAHSVKLTTSQPLPVQVDGEAWVLSPCSIEVKMLNKYKVLVYEGKTYKPPTKASLEARVEIQELAKFSFTIDKLEAVKKEYPNNQLNKAQFIHVLNQITGLKFDEKNPVLTDRLFTIFDLDKSGSIDFKELSVGLSTLGSGSLEKKLKFVFGLFDTSNTGHINREQLTVAFRTLFSMQYSGDSEKLVKIYVSIFVEVYDTNKDDNITFDELHLAAQNDKVLAHLFTFGSA